jgi:hypothetical protein
VSDSFINPAQEMAEAGRIAEAAARRALDAKTARLKALRLAKEEDNRKAKAKPWAAQ